MPVPRLSQLIADQSFKLAILQYPAFKPDEVMIPDRQIRLKAFAGDIHVSVAVPWQPLRL